MVQVSAFDPMDGVLLFEPDVQKYPASHKPSGSDKPVWLQYIPPEHAWHSEESTRLVTLLKVPVGHGYWYALVVFSGQ
jgi:hypothetical protein